MQREGFISVVVSVAYSAGVLRRRNESGRRGLRFGNLLIEFACGKVPLRAHRDGGVRRSGCLVFSQGALLKEFQKVLSEIWEPTASQ